MKNENVQRSVMVVTERESDSDIHWIRGLSPYASNVAEQLIEKGLASVVRHKRDDEDRSSDYDKLMAAEQASVILLFSNDFASWGLVICIGQWQIKEESILVKKSPLQSNRSTFLRSVSLYRCSQAFSLNIAADQQSCRSVPERVQAPG